MNRMMRFVGAAIALAVGAAGCIDSEPAPLAPADAGPARAAAATVAHKSAAKVKVAGMTWLKPLKSDVAASALIGAEGGVLVLPATGLRLVVPAGAVDRPTQFRATAIAGKLVAYDFEPAGSTFPVALRVEQSASFVDVRRTEWTGVVAGYFPSRADLDQTRAAADVAELIPVTRSATTIAFPVSHFSGYIVSWGFRDSDGGEP